MVRRQGGWRLGTVWFFVVEEVAKIRDGVVVDGGGWFEESIKRKVCNGVVTPIPDVSRKSGTCV
jgi:hypothetical protein